MIYASAETLSTYFPTDTKPEERQILLDDLEAASRFVDRATGRPDNYFAPAVEDVEATPEITADPVANPPVVGAPAVAFVDNSFIKRFYGNGRTILRIDMFSDNTLTDVAAVIENPTANPPIIGVPAKYAVTAQSGVLPVYRIVKRQADVYLESNYIWNYGEWFDVRAHWGFTEIPAAIKKAVVQIVLGWRQRERGILGQTNPEGFVQETDIPLSAKTLIEPYKLDSLDDFAVEPDLRRSNNLRLGFYSRYYA